MVVARAGAPQVPRATLGWSLWMSGRSSAVISRGQASIGFARATRQGAFSLCPRLCVPPVTKADTCATTVLFNEDYARGFQRPTDGKFIGGC